MHPYWPRPQSGRSYGVAVFTEVFVIVCIFLRSSSMQWGPGCLRTCPTKRSVICRKKQDVSILPRESCGTKEEVWGDEVPSGSGADTIGHGGHVPPVSEMSGHGSTVRQRTVKHNNASMTEWCRHLNRTLPAQLPVANDIGVHNRCH